MELTEKTLSSETIFDGRILHVRRDTVLLPNGHQSTREVVDHPGGVGVLALDGQGRALLVSQFRYPYGQVLREIPAGKLEKGEDPKECARRELFEETGLSAGKLEELGVYCSSPDVLEEKTEIVYEKEIPLVLQIVSSGGISAAPVDSFYNPEELISHGYDKVMAITILFSQKPLS